MNLSYKDIIKRQRNLMTGVSHNSNVNVNQLYDSLKENYSYHKAKLILENWAEFGDEEIAFIKQNTPVDYQYDGGFSPLRLIDYLEDTIAESN